VSYNTSDFNHHLLWLHSVLSHWNFSLGSSTQCAFSDFLGRFQENSKYTSGRNEGNEALVRNSNCPHDLLVALCSNRGRRLVDRTLLDAS